MPRADDTADLWPNTTGLAPGDRTRMEAHADVLLEIAAQACRKANPGEARDDTQVAYIALALLLQRSELTRAELTAVMPLLLTDAALAVGAVELAPGDHLVVTPENCRQVLVLMSRNAAEGLNRVLASPAAATAAAAGGLH